MNIEAEWNISFRLEASRLTAMMVRQFGLPRLDLIEDAVQETFIRALKAWKTDGPPENHRSWLALVAKRIVIDRLRRDRIYTALPAEELLPCPEPADRLAFDEDELSLFRLCCHPSLSPTSQIILTLREVGGFTTREIAACLLTAESTIAQRLVRTKRTLRTIDPDKELGDETQKIESFRRVLYLMFNRGYSFQTESGSAEAIELCDQAISLTLRLSRSAATSRPATHALLALMYLQSSRINSRLDPTGACLRLEEQDSKNWDQTRIALGVQALGAASEGDKMTSYHLEAAIAAEYATCDPIIGPDWSRILTHYDDLLNLYPTEVVRLNRAIVVGMIQGPEAALALLDKIRTRGRLSGYHHLESARAFFLERSARKEESKTALHQALLLATHEGDRKLLQRRLQAVSVDLNMN